MKHAGRALLVGFEGTTLDSATASAIREIGPAGAILFARNLSDPETLSVLRRDLARVLPAPGLIAIDQEGGRVSRLKPWIGPTAPAATLAGRGPDAARRIGASTGKALRGLGFNLDFAPVVDLSAPDVPNGIGDRSFGEDPLAVASLAGAFLEGLQAEGVAGCIKHFPGLGRTAVDSHLEMPTCALPRERLDAEDLLPFRRLAAAAACVMVGHAHYPALDAEARPASLSPAVVRGLLLDGLGFRGLVATDDVEMGAAAPFDAEGGAAVAALRAGCDLVLYCRDLDRALRARRALETAARDDDAFAARLAGAARAVERLAARFPAGDPDLALFDAARREFSVA